MTGPTDPPLNREPLGRPLFAGGIVALGVADLVYRNVLMWKILPPGLRGAAVLSVATGVLLLFTGACLLVQRYQVPASRMLLAFFLLWDVLVGIPPVVVSPTHEAYWLVLGMITMVALAGWQLAGMRGLPAVHTVFGLALIPVGLSHFFYFQVTLDLVPAWLPPRAFWVYLAGAAHVAAGLGLLLRVFPRLAVMLEAAMLMAFAILVWIPRVIAHPDVQFNWTELLGTWVVGAAAWVMADSLAGTPWLGRRSPPSSPSLPAQSRPAPSS